MIPVSLLRTAPHAKHRLNQCHLTSRDGLTRYLQRINDLQHKMSIRFLLSTSDFWLLHLTFWIWNLTFDNWLLKFFHFQTKVLPDNEKWIIFQTRLFSELLQNIAFRISGSTDLLVYKSKWKFEKFQMLDVKVFNRSNMRSSISTSTVHYGTF